MSVAPSTTTAGPLFRTGEQRLLLPGVRWEQYEALRLALDDHPAVRLTYLKGALEIMVTSAEHERIKKMIARLLEIYAFERGVPLNGYGQTTFRRRAAERGLEPDECYVLGGKLAGMPDLAIEVALTSGGIDKLAVYAGLGVGEVWIWRDGALEVWSLALPQGAYERTARSRLLPDLDVGELTRFVGWEDQTAAVRAYRDALGCGGAG